MESRSVRIIAIVILTLAGCTARAQTARQIDTEKSSLTVRVYKSGLFSAFAHDHEIRASVQSGNFDE